MDIQEYFNNQKKTFLEMMLPLCPFILINKENENLVVPESLKENSELILRVGRARHVMGMPDLVLDETGWSATISLRGSRFLVSVPWAACMRYWVGEPFAGPFVIWPDVVQNEQPKPGLKLVK